MTEQYLDGNLDGARLSEWAHVKSLDGNLCGKYLDGNLDEQYLDGNLDGARLSERAHVKTLDGNLDGKYLDGQIP